VSRFLCCAVCGPPYRPLVNLTITAVLFFVYVANLRPRTALASAFKCLNGDNLFADYTGQQSLTFFLFHEEKYLILIVLLTLNSNV
jgi:hypothetical protein